MITYFDTSAIIPLIIGEPSTERCERFWNESTRTLSVRLVYPEARASLARAQRMGRVTRSQLDAAVIELGEIVGEVDQIEVDAGLARSAGDLAQAHGLRGYDAVHLAAAWSAADADLVLVTGDVDLATAATAMGIAVATTIT